MNRVPLLLIASVVAVVVLATSCGGENTPPPPPPDRPVVNDIIPGPTSAPCEESNLDISVKGDALEFDTGRLEVATGTEVALCFKNASNVFQHNWVLVKPGTKDEVAKRGINHPENGYVQPDDPDAIANTSLINKGEEGEVRFAAPQPGPYQFVCTFPGHNAVMFGDFVVTP